MINIPINLAVEDDLSEIVLREMLRQSQRNFIVGTCLKQRGFGYLKTAQINSPSLRRAMDALANFQ
jgi:hypothetical protein